MISCFPEFSESWWRRRVFPLRSNWRKADSKEPHHSLVLVVVKPRHSLVGSQLLNVEAVHNAGGSWSPEACSMQQPSRLMGGSCSLKCVISPGKCFPPGKPGDILPQLIPLKSEPPPSCSDPTFPCAVSHRLELVFPQSKTYISKCKPFFF